MEHRIIQKEAFHVTGKVFTVSTIAEGHHMRIAELWEKSQTDGTCENISASDSSQNLLGITWDYDSNREQLWYMIAIETVQESNKIRLETREISAANWAVFTAKGPLPHSIVNLFSEIYQKWFPETGLAQANAPMLEVYLPGDPSGKDYVCELWVPVIKK